MDSNQDLNIAGDRLNVLLLTFLYVVQYLPGCMLNAVSLILQKRNASYADQAEFSLAAIPFSFNLLWAPIVDGVYSKKVGRRKSWVVLTQYLIGISLLYLASNFDDWLGSEDGTRKPQTRTLGLVFFWCTFLASTQSIAVGGWSLTMLQKKNVGLAGICDNVGYAISQFLGYILFIVLESKEICNRFRSAPQDHGFVPPSESTLIWAIVFIVSSTLILIFKKEANLACSDGDDHERKLGLKESYTRLWQIIKTVPVRKMCFIFFTYQVGLAPFNSLANLKLIDAGVSRDTFALLTVPSLPFVVLGPLVLTRFLVGHQAMRTFIITYVSKLIFGILYTTLIFFTPLVKDEKNELPAWHDGLLIFIYSANVLIEFVMFVAIGAFFSRISDPRFGGTYLTVLQTVSNVGYRLPTSLCLWLVDFLTIQSCSHDEAKGTVECVVILDGFFTEVFVCSLIALLWVYWAKKKTYELEDMDVSEWRVKT